MTLLACIHHLEQPSLGLSAEPLRRAGLELDERFLRRGDALPGLDQVDGLLTLGGEQSLREIDQYPYLLEEVGLLRSAVEQGVPTLGICLGGQLLAHSQGAEIGRLPQRVIAWPEVRHTVAGAADPLFATQPEPVATLHWNEDYFTVPDGAVELLSRSDLGGEAIRVGDRAWGVQFHPEGDRGILDGWYRLEGLLDEAGVSKDGARAADRERMPGQRKNADALFSAFAREVLKVSSDAPEQPGASAANRSSRRSPGS